VTLSEPRKDRRTDGRQTVTLRLPLDAASVIIGPHYECLVIMLNTLKLTGILISFRSSFSKVRSFPEQKMISAQAIINAFVQNIVYSVGLGAVK